MQANGFNRNQSKAHIKYEKKSRSSFVTNSYAGENTANGGYKLDKTMKHP